MKLNYKRTILVGFAFFLISAFWQAYDATIPVILTNKFGMSQRLSGFVMALDNILAVFMLPLFGALSDKCIRNRFGKRTPFITIGTVIAAVALLCLSFADASQLNVISEVSKIDDSSSMTVIYESQADTVLKTPEGDKYVLSQKFTEDEFVAIKSRFEAVNVADPLKILKKSGFELSYTDGEDVYLAKEFSREAFASVITSVKKEADGALLQRIYDADIPIRVIDGKGYILTNGLSEETVDSFHDLLKAPLIGEAKLTKEVTNPQYTNYVVPARQAYAAAATEKNPSALIWFIVLLLVILVAMAVFRSPAVALMPDVTIKPLRSKANAVINLMGTAGGIIVLVLGIVFATSAVRNQLMNYTVYYLVIAGMMLGALAIFLLTVKEKKWAKQMEEDTLKLGIVEEEETSGETRKLTRSEICSLLLILASVALWYFGYNAVTSKYSVYAGNILNMDYNTTMLIAQGFAIVAYLPAGIVASKIGRKKTILAGVVMLTTAFAAASFLRSGSSVMVMNVLFALAGIGWATINVNSFPMVVEMCSGGKIGKYTGYYYTASMTAQIFTPYLSGFLMDEMGMTVLFPYAAIFAGLAFVTMFFVRHGDAKPEAKVGLEALDTED